MTGAGGRRGGGTTFQSSEKRERKQNSEILLLEKADRLTQPTGTGLMSGQYRATESGKWSPELWFWGTEVSLLSSPTRQAEGCKSRGVTPAPTWTNLEDVLPKCYQPDAEGQALRGATSRGTWGGKLSETEREQSLLGGSGNHCWVGTETQFGKMRTV